MKSTEERLRRPSIAVPPPPRPARRRPVIESKPPLPVEPVEEGFDEQVYYRRLDTEDGQQENRRAGRQDARRPRSGRQTGEPKVRYSKEGERILFRIHQTAYLVIAAYVVALIIAALIAALVAKINLPIWVALTFGVICFFPAIKEHIDWLRTVYILTETKIEIETGLLSTTSRNIPLRHVLDVSVSESFKEKILGIGDIEIDTASAESKIRLNNVHYPRKYTQMILDQLHGWNYP
jgi:membrane protein YdbS with pleckstrin-like domain